MEIVEGILCAFGLDPFTETLGRVVVRYIGASLVKAMEMARRPCPGGGRAGRGPVGNSGRDQRPPQLRAHRRGRPSGEWQQGQGAAVGLRGGRGPRRRAPLPHHRGGRGLWIEISRCSSRAATTRGAKDVKTAIGATGGKRSRRHDLGEGAEPGWAPSGAEGGNRHLLIVDSDGCRASRPRSSWPTLQRKTERLARVLSSVRPGLLRRSSPGCRQPRFFPHFFVRRGRHPQPASTTRSPAWAPPALPTSRDGWGAGSGTACTWKRTQSWSWLKITRPYRLSLPESADRTRIARPCWASCSGRCRRTSRRRSNLSYRCCSTGQTKGKRLPIRFLTTTMPSKSWSSWSSDGRSTHRTFLTSSMNCCRSPNATTAKPMNVCFRFCVTT